MKRVRARSPETALVVQLFLITSIIVITTIVMCVCAPAGLSKQSYYLTVGKQICESVDAQNDETYRSFT
jgi:hypothetical protein